MAKGKLLLIALSENKDEETFEVRWAGTLAGTIVVPKDSGKPIEFKKTVLVKPSQLRLIAGHLYKQFKKEICIHGSRKTVIFGAKDFEKQKTKRVADTEWKRYYNMINKYIGKYREFEQKGKIGAELVLKKKISTKDALFEISIFLKKYPMIKLSVMQVTQNPVDIDDKMSKSTIESIVIHVLTWEQVKSNAVSDSKKQTVLISNSEPEEEPEYKIVDQTPRTDVDPIILSKKLTLYQGKKQSREEAISKAQKKANEQYLYIKLLDQDGKFITNIYPNISKKEVAFRRGGRIKDLIYTKLFDNDREIGD